MKTIIVQWITDPGHAWLQVNRSVVAELDIKVSGFSYMNSHSVYLEEDCDASNFIIAVSIAGHQLEYLPEIVEKYNDSVVRSMASYWSGS